MNTSNAIEIVMTASLATVVVGGLIAAGMSTAVVAGAAIGGTYLLVK